MKAKLAAVPIVLLAAAVISFQGGMAHAQRSESPGDKTEGSHPKSSLWMRQKLSASQNILEAMTQADFEAIEKNAQSMRAVGYLEGWVRSGVPGYKPQFRAFNQANSEIARAAKDKNLDGVTIAYTQLMVSCVQCHTLIRDRAYP